jgi:asparaginyl-tRNA synthetase
VIRVPMGASSHKWAVIAATCATVAFGPLPGCQGLEAWCKVPAMDTISVRRALSGAVSEGSKVRVRGWVRTRRDSKAGLSFVNLSDGSCFDPIQVVAPNTLSNYATEIQRLTAGCSIVVEGTLVPSQGKGQSFEVQADAILVTGLVDDPEKYPIQPKAHSMEYLREVAHLRPRTNTFGAVARVRHCMAQAIHRYFHEREFFWVNTPIITASDCEGAGQMFRVSTLDMLNLPRKDKEQGAGVDYGQDFFGKEAFLTVSGQLNVEAYCLALSKVYTFGPTFRAENSNTTRHLAEFWMIEPEIAFANLHDDADLAEDFLKYVFRAVLTERADDMKFFVERVEKTAISRLETLIEQKFERIDYTEAIKLVESSGKKWEYPVSWGTDLQTEHERYLTEEKIGRPVVVMNYPEQIKAFYMRLNDDEKTVAAMDILAPGIGEIIGGSQREERLDVLESRMAKMHLPKAPYEWYLDLRRYGTVPHAGFGLGFERLVVYVCGLANIRDAIPYPRAPKTAEF